MSVVVLDDVIKHYGIVSFPYEGPSFILPDGSYLDLTNIKHHSDVEYWLDQSGLSNGQAYNRLSGSPTLKSLGCIRVSTNNYYIQLPDSEITDLQYGSLKLWIKFLFDEVHAPFLDIIGPFKTTYAVKDPDYLIQCIRKYYKWKFDLLNS